MKWISAYRAARRGNTDYTFEVSNMVLHYQVEMLVNRIISNREKLIDGLRELALAQWTQMIDRAECNTSATDNLFPTRVEWARKSE